MAGITIIGLGPGNPSQITREAWEVIHTATEIWLRTRQHPTVASLPRFISSHLMLYMMMAHLLKVCMLPL
jgi:uncharacterized protein YabN with tetrapyrrole methylase and pyrophosphatase domain